MNTKVQSKNSNRKQKNDKPPKDFSIVKAVRQDKEYKSNVVRRDRKSRQYIDENCDVKNPKVCYPGQLVMFNYFEPKTKDQLQYYDAMPCTLYFGTVRTDEGVRYIGWNAHYYPPRIRWQIFERVYEIFKPMYLKDWGQPLSHEMDYFNYKMIVQQLQKAKLDFGVREYIPQLMNKIVPVPINMWPKALLTEGVFKKETRAQILAYWKAKSDGITKPKTVVVGKDGKKHKVK